MFIEVDANKARDLARRGWGVYAGKKWVRCLFRFFA